MIFDRAEAHVQRYKEYLLMVLGVATLALSAAGYACDLQSHSVMLARQCSVKLKLVRDTFVALFRLA